VAFAHPIAGQLPDGPVVRKDLLGQVANAMKEPHESQLVLPSSSHHRKRCPKYPTCRISPLIRRKPVTAVTARYRRQGYRAAGYFHILLTEENMARAQRQARRARRRARRATRRTARQARRTGRRVARRMRRAGRRVIRKARRAVRRRARGARRTGRRVARVRRVVGRLAAEAPEATGGEATS